MHLDLAWAQGFKFGAARRELFILRTRGESPILYIHQRHTPPLYRSLELGSGAKYGEIRQKYGSEQSPAFQHTMVIESPTIISNTAVPVNP